MGITQSSEPQEILQSADADLKSVDADYKEKIQETTENTQTVELKIEKREQLEDDAIYMYCLWKIKKYKKNRGNNEKINKEFLDENTLSKIDKIMLDKFLELNVTLESSDISSLNNNIKLNSELNMKKSLYKSITKEYNNLENEYNNLIADLNNMKYDNYELYNRIDIDKIYEKLNFIDKTYNSYIEKFNDDSFDVLEKEYKIINEIFTDNINELEKFNKIIDELLD
jgi:hypothetical protein